MEFIIRYIFFSAAMLTMLKLSNEKWEKRRHLTAAAFFIIAEAIFLL